jgi:hypothetical protein
MEVGLADERAQGRSAAQTAQACGWKVHT